MSTRQNIHLVVVFHESMALHTWSSHLMGRPERFTTYSCCSSAGLEMLRLAGLRLSARIQNLLSATVFRPQHHDAPLRASEPVKNGRLKVGNPGKLSLTLRKAKRFLFPHPASPNPTFLEILPGIHCTKLRLCISPISKQRPLTHQVWAKF